MAETDLISRQDAIGAVLNSLPDDEYWNEQVKKAISALPSAQPKTGKWIYNSPVAMKCNQCGLVIKDWDWHRFKYCPNCIAEMRGEQDE